MGKFKDMAKPVAGLLPHVCYEALRKRFQTPPPPAPQPIAVALIQLLNQRYPEVGISLLDIGARLGLTDHGLRDLIALANLRVEGIEPDRDEAVRLLADPELGRYQVVHPVVVYDVPASLDLYLTRIKGCSSVKRPLSEKIQHLTCSSWFEVLGKERIQVVPLATLYGTERQFDYIKIDVQGAEMEVIRGGAELFEKALGVMIEVQFQPLYEGQALFPEVHGWFQKRGYHIVGFENHSGFYNGDLVEADCAYIKSPDSIASRESFLKRLLFSAICGNDLYIEMLLRCHAGKFFTQDEIQAFIDAMHVEINPDKLDMLGPHN